MSQVLDETAEPETAPDTEEPETGDQEEEEEAEPEAAPEAAAPPAVTEAAMEKFFKGLATRTATLDRWIEAELGDNYADLSACPLCSDGIVGHIYPPEWITPTSDVQARLLEVLKTPGAPEYREDPNTHECNVCGGWGKTLTRSHVAGKTERVCKHCHGTGYISQDGPELVATNGAEPTDEYELPNEQPLAGGENDIWGSPRTLPDGQENPNYGKMPQYKNPTLP